MTRAYGWLEPVGLILIPFIDFVNHNFEEVALYNLINNQIELNPNNSNFHCSFNQKGYNLELLGIEIKMISEIDIKGESFGKNDI